MSNMNILILGSGGREYSIGLALQQDSRIQKLYYAPGNGATSAFATNLPLGDYRELADFAVQEKIDLVIVGPEQPLVEGAADIFREAGLKVFGPSAQAARLEASKSFMKSFVSAQGIPTARFLETSDAAEADAFIDEMNTPIVVKADGLCAGKGVVICQSHEEAKTTAQSMLSGEQFGEAGNKVVIEEFLDGYELSVFALCDGKDYILLPACQDHKRLKDNDEGPNTGGMGAYCPTPLSNESLMDEVAKRIVEPTLQGMQAEGMPFEGVLFCGLMVVKGELYLLEFNVRFGDPECEVLMPMLHEGELLDILMACSEQRLASCQVKPFEGFAMGVVLASGNYPYGKSEPAVITVPDALPEGTHVSYAGVKAEDGKILATGGRVLVCVGKGATLQEARDRAYALAESVQFDGKQYRQDIGARALKPLS